MTNTPLAEGLTPNGFELAHLTGLAVNDVESVVAAARTQADVIVHPRIDANPKGTGDLFCATLTGHWLNGVGLSEATIQTCRHVVQALRHTEQAQCAELLLPMADSHDNRRTAAHECVSKFTYRIFPCKQPLPI